MKISRTVFRSLLLVFCAAMMLGAAMPQPCLASDIEVPTVSAPTIAPPAMPKVPQPQMPQLPQIKAVKMEVDRIAQDIDNRARGNMKVEYKKDPDYKAQEPEKIQTNNVPPTSAANTVAAPAAAQQAADNRENGLQVHSTTTIEKNDLPPEKKRAEAKNDGNYFKTHFFALLAQLFGQTSFIALTIWVMQIFLFKRFPIWIDCLSFALIDSIVAAIYLAMLHKGDGGYIFAGQALSSDELLALGSGFVFCCLLAASCLSFFFYQKNKRSA